MTLNSQQYANLMVHAHDVEVDSKKDQMHLDPIDILAPSVGIVGSGSAVCMQNSASQVA